MSNPYVVANKVHDVAELENFVGVDIYGHEKRRSQSL